MPQEKFHVVVEVVNRFRDNNSIATAGAYLAYADQTDTIGYNPDFRHTEVHTDSTGAPIEVSFSVIINIASDEHLDAFMSEMNQLSRVQEVEHIGVLA